MKLGLWGLGFSPVSNSSVLPFPHRLEKKWMEYGFNRGGGDQDCEAVPISLPLNPNEVLKNAAVSSHAVFALTSSGRILAWGCAQQGRLGGDNLTCMEEERPDSSIIEGLGFVLQVASASEHSLALNSEGAVYSWGSSVAGRLGVGTERSAALPFRAGHIPFTRVPERINSLPRIVGLACADLHCLAVSSDGEVYVWGSASMGRLGIGSDVHSLQHAEASQPLRVKRLMGLYITQVACAKANSGALCSTGQIFTWGAACYGLASSPANSSSQDEPALLLCTPNGHRFARIAMGKFHALAMSTTGRVFSWGWAGDGGLGHGPPADGNLCRAVDKASEVLALAAHPVRQIACGEASSVAVCMDGRVCMWGSLPLRSSALYSVGQRADADACDAAVCVCAPGRDAPQHVALWPGFLRRQPPGHVSLAAMGCTATALLFVQEQEQEQENSSGNIPQHHQQTHHQPPIGSGQKRRAFEDDRGVGGGWRGTDVCADASDRL